VVILTGRISRVGRIALPFVLLFIGAAAFYVSPWPAILRAAIGGAHIHVFPTWETVGLPLITVVTWAGSIWLSLQVRPHSN
jgi:hypothetical protein